MAQKGLEKFGSSSTISADKTTLPSSEVLDTEGNPIGEPEIEEVMKSKEVTREQAIGHIKTVRKLAYEKRQLAVQQSNPVTVRDTVPEVKTQKEIIMEKEESQALATIESSELPSATDAVKMKPEMTIEDAVRRNDYLTQVFQKVLKKGIHYGNPQKNGKGVWPHDKLLKSGAEVIARMFGLRGEPTTIESMEDHDHLIYRFKVRCELVHIRTGSVMAIAISTASSKEKSFSGQQGEELWNNVLAKAQKRAFVKAVEFATGVDEFFTDEKTYSP